MATTSRRAARELALNVLYQVDVVKTPPQEALETAIENVELDAAASEFVTTLVNGTLEHLKIIDEKLKELSVGWDLQRQPAVDRNILRMAIYEIMYLDHIPASVSINEAVDIAKKFSTDESGRFINGVLGTLVCELETSQEDKNAGTDS